MVEFSVNYEFLGRAPRFKTTVDAELKNGDQVLTHGMVTADRQSVPVDRTAHVLEWDEQTHEGFFEFDEPVPPIVEQAI